MALIKCRECGNEISKKAKSCPKCGTPNKPKLFPTFSRFLAGLKNHPKKLGVLLLALFIFPFIPQGLVIAIVMLSVIIFGYALLNIAYPFKKFGLNTRKDAWGLCWAVLVLFLIGAVQLSGRGTGNVPDASVATHAVMPQKEVVAETKADITAPAKKDIAVQPAPKSKSVYEDSNKQFAWVEQGKELAAARLKDPASAKFRNVVFRKAVLEGKAIPMVCGEINSKNSFGGYAGYQHFLSAGEASFTIFASDMASKEFADLWNKLCAN